MPVIKIVELIGTSPDSFEDAINKAVERSSKTIKNITGVDIVGQKAVVKNNKITEYRVVLKVAFTVE